MSERRTGVTAAAAAPSSGRSRRGRSAGSLGPAAALVLEDVQRLPDLRQPRVVADPGRAEAAADPVEDGGEVEELGTGFEVTVGPGPRGGVMGESSQVRASSRSELPDRPRGASPNVPGRGTGPETCPTS